VRKLVVRLGGRTYPVFIQPYGLDNLADLMKRMGLSRECVVISDRSVSTLYGNRIIKILKDSDFNVSIHSVQDGERSKSLKTVSTLYTYLLDNKLKRDGVIIAFGGGVVGDLAGFVASTYLRGVTLIQIPTTLLSQVDSSIGGKVGINHPKGKNLIGSFYQPKFVLIDPNLLLTLKEREIWSGLGEVVKYGMIMDRRFFAFMEKNLESIANLRDEDLVAKMIGVSCRIKASVVSKDEREGGYRRILNFGHTIGHALEAAGNFKYFRHGESVVYGMHWASWVSRDKGYLSEIEFKRIENLLKRFKLPELPDFLSADELYETVGLDKKQTSGGLNVVLLDRIGRVRIERQERLSYYIEGWLDYVRK